MSEHELIQISKLFLHRKFDEAHSKCLLHLQPNTNSKITTLSPKARKLLILLYLRIAAERVHSGGEGADGRDGSSTGEWQDAVEWYGGIGFLPADVLAVGIQLLLKQARYQESRDAFETWLSLQNDSFFTQAAAASSPPRNGVSMQADSVAVDYECLVELYVLHILPKMEDWNSAKEFLTYNDVLSDEKRDAFMKHLETLRIRALDSTTTRQTTTRNVPPPPTQPTPQPQEPPTVAKISSSPPQLPPQPSSSPPRRPGHPPPQQQLNPPSTLSDSFTPPRTGQPPSALLQALIVLSPILGLSALIAILVTREPLKSRIAAFFASPMGVGLMKVWSRIYETVKMGVNVQTF